MFYARISVKKSPDSAPSICDMAWHRFAASVAITPASQPGCRVHANASRARPNGFKKKEHQITASASHFLYVPLPGFGLFLVAGGRAKCGLSGEKCGLAPQMWTSVDFTVKNVDSVRIDTQPPRPLARKKVPPPTPAGGIAPASQI
jgi:hypothetical protein